MSEHSEYKIPFESYKTLLEIQGLADGIKKSAEEIYEYDTEALAKDLLIVIKEIGQKAFDVFESAQPVSKANKDL